MFETLLTVLAETLGIILLVAAMMTVVEFLELKYQEKIRLFFTDHKSMQIVLSSFMGSLPGCTGTFFIDTLYMAGLVGFGGIIAVMVSTFGDEAYVLIANAFSKESNVTIMNLVVLFSILFILGIVAGYLADFYQRRFKLKLCEHCHIEHHYNYKENFSFKHFFEDHVWKHVIKKHIPKLFFWLYFSIFIFEVIGESFDVNSLMTDNKYMLIALAGIIGIFPISGPNLIFITLFSKGMIPMSVLVTNSIVQDGHGLLPLLSYSLDDSFKIKLFNLVFGLIVGYLMLFMGF